MIVTSPTQRMSNTIASETSNVNKDVLFVRSSLPENRDQTTTKEEYACIRVLRPILTYMKFMGLDRTFCRPAFRPFFKLFSAIVLFLQLAAVVGCVIQIDPPNEGLTTSTTLKICSITYLSIGAASTIMLYIFQDKMILVQNAIVRELPEGTDLPEYKNLKRTSSILVGFTVAMSFLNAFSLFCTKMGFVEMPPMHIFTTLQPFWVLDILIIWLSQSSMMMAASIFTVFCKAIRKSLVKIGDDMKCKGDGDGDIFDYQKQYQALTDAADLLEQAYSLFILFIYAVTVPVICFILFTILRGQGMDLLGTLVLLFWGFDIILILFFVSIPAILLYEQGDKLLKCCYQMYNIHVGSEKNTMLFQQSVQFLASQISASPLSMTAGNFFVLSREMLLTLFSQILTYFIILLQSPT